VVLQKARVRQRLNEKRSLDENPDARPSKNLVWSRYWGGGRALRGHLEKSYHIPLLSVHSSQEEAAFA
jgi:hypothetical protein